MAAGLGGPDRTLLQEAPAPPAQRELPGAWLGVSALRRRVVLPSVRPFHRMSESGPAAAPGRLWVTLRTPRCRGAAWPRGLPEDGGCCLPCSPRLTPSQACGVVAWAAALSSKGAAAREQSCSRQAAGEGLAAQVRLGLLNSRGAERAGTQSWTRGWRQSSGLWVWRVSPAPPGPPFPP